MPGAFVTVALVVGAFVAGAFIARIFVAMAFFMPLYHSSIARNFSVKCQVQLHFFQVPCTIVEL